MSGALDDAAGTVEGDTDSDVTQAPIKDEYTWSHFMREVGYGTEVDQVYEPEEADASSSWLRNRSEPRKPSNYNWNAGTFDPVEWLGFHPDELPERVQGAAGAAKGFNTDFERSLRETPAIKGLYTWEHFKWEHYYIDGKPPRTDGEIQPFDPADYLGFDPDDIEKRFSDTTESAMDLRRVIDRRTVNVNPKLDEDSFFRTVNGHTTLVNRYDLEKEVNFEKKGHFFEVERYWVDKPYTFVIIFHSLRENEKKYYVISPHRTDIENQLMEFLSGKLRTAIKYSDDDVIVGGTDEDRRSVLERETQRLLKRYDLYDETESWRDAPLERAKELLSLLGDESPSGLERPPDKDLDGLMARPEPAVLEEDSGTLSEYQVYKLLYQLERDFLGYERIDGIKHDINVEDISCDGYNSRVFVYHTAYENIISNIEHGKEELDDFVVKLAQRSGKGISQRRPQVDATLPDGSRAQLTLGEAVSDHGTNYTIRQFMDVPFTPVDLINWNTFSLEQLSFLWLCIENERSLIFAGGTASGKTTSLNACSLFIPSNAKIVSIEDTREVELPQRNWVASVTRPSFGTSQQGNVDEFDLLEGALRQRPDFIVMGEVRGEEGRTLFQVMSTGHTTLTTFHADDVGEVLKRFTTDPINVSKTLFTSLDLISVQTQTRVQGQKVRRNKTITEINHYEADNDEINVQDVYQWDPESDVYEPMGKSNTLQRVKFDRGWNQETLERKLFERQVVLAYLVVNGFKDYADVAATLQGFIQDPDSILTMLANDRLHEHLQDLRRMESVSINVEPEKEALVPRPDPDEETYERAASILDIAEEELFPEFEGERERDLAEVLASISKSDDFAVEAGSGERLKDMFFEARFFQDEGDPPGLEASPDSAPAISNGGTDSELQSADRDDTGRDE